MVQSTPQEEARQLRVRLPLGDVVRSSMIFLSPQSPYCAYLCPIQGSGAETPFLALGMLFGACERAEQLKHLPGSKPFTSPLRHTAQGNLFLTPAQVSI